jgi:hypothetical protein
MLVAWSRRYDYLLGFGPFPIIFLPHLFLFFKDYLFRLQFVLVSFGFLGHAFVNRALRSDPMNGAAWFAKGEFLVRDSSRDESGSEYFKNGAPEMKNPLSSGFFIL